MKMFIISLYDSSLYLMELFICWLHYSFVTWRSNPFVACFPEFTGHKVFLWRWWSEEKIPKYKVSHRFICQSYYYYIVGSVILNHSNRHMGISFYSQTCKRKQNKKSFAIVNRITFWNPSLCKVWEAWVMSQTEWLKMTSVISEPRRAAPCLFLYFYMSLWWTIVVHLIKVQRGEE